MDESRVEVPHSPVLGQSDDSALERLLAGIDFADSDAARHTLRRLIRDGDTEVQAATAELLPHLLIELSRAARPDRVLVNLERFARSAPDRAVTLRNLALHPRALEILLRVSAGSQFLTEILLRNPEYLERLAAHKELTKSKSVEEFRRDAQAAVQACAPPEEAPSRMPKRDWWCEPLNALRRFQRWEFLRIGTCDLLGLLDLPVVTAQLSNLADSLVDGCLDIVSRQLSIPPVPSNGAGGGLAVIALGKLGGRELNYSSDIDLLFLAGSDAGTYHRLAERLIEALTRFTAEGFLYRVDLRLRPWGEVGPLVSSMEGYLAYLNEYARLWEKQALLKARPISGDMHVGEQLVRRVEPLLFSSATQSIRSDVHAMKQRTEAHLRGQGRTWGEVKLGEGSIRDVEFVVQYLQLAHGAALPQIRSANTLDALQRLSDHHLLPNADLRILADGYVLLRSVEHYLQMMHYQQTHTLPDDDEALAHLARRLGFRGTDTGAQLVTRYEQHCNAIRAVYLRYLGSDAMETPQADPQAPSAVADVHRHVARMDASYLDVFNEQEIHRHAVLAERLDDEHLVNVEAAPLGDGYWRVTIVAYDYPGELSLICGLLFAYGFSIQDGEVFTYERIDSPARGDAETGAAAWKDTRRKIVDVFTVRRVGQDSVTPDMWAQYADDLAGLLQIMHAGQRRAARGDLAKRIAAVLEEADHTPTPLYPVDIEIDNTASEHYTVLRIDAPDTVGFLYEFTNALAFNRIYIARVSVDSIGSRVRDILYVTDADGNKITTPDRQRELRAATVLIKHFTHLLPRSSNPEAALLHFREFLGQLFQRPDWPDELASLERHEVLEALARVLGVSDFLWDDFLRMQYANLFPVVRDVDALHTVKSRRQLQAELERALRPVHDGPQPPSPDLPWRTTLNAFKDREMFRIDMRHIMGHTKEFWDFSDELTDLAEVVVNSAYHLCHEDLRSVYGSPRLADGDVSEMAVCALGKCGGRELGFASDIELMFIYSGNGETTGPQTISTAEFYEKLVQMFITAIQAKREGIFEIDLQLRPYGQAGSMAVSAEAFQRYFAPDGPAWAHERQALVKLRPIAGSPELGQYIAALRDQFVYTGEAFDVHAMRAMRERQLRHLVAGGTFNAKYSPGGLADLEYLVEGLQITHGHREPSLRRTNIREAMAALAATGIISEVDYRQMRKAHTFLRWLIDALRMVRGNAKDLTVPPDESEEFAFLARRLRYGKDVERLRTELAGYTTAVLELSARLLP
ncbi:MAG: glutamine synthetase adenylyltransferase [Anaerolineales bacterium]|nr:glutamine synthetase adenylyltransferase [Anaerolineales bacterium]